MKTKNKDFLAKNYDLEALEIELLEGYDSKNYRIETASEVFVLKLYKNEANLRDLLIAENQVLQMQKPATHIRAQF